MLDICKVFVCFFVTYNIVPNDGSVQLLEYFKAVKLNAET